MQRYDHLDGLGTAQGSVWSREQARAAGFTWAMIDRQVRDRQWVSAEAGVYRPAGAETTLKSDLFAAVLACGEAYVSHVSVLADEGLMGAPPRVHVTVPFTHEPTPKGPVVHRSRRLLAVDLRVRDGLPMTTLTRAFADSVGMLTDKALRQALGEALRRGHVDGHQLTRRMRELNRKGIRRVESYFDRLPDDMVSMDSVLEVEAGRLLVAHGITGWKHHHRISTPIGPIEIDYGFPLLCYALELNGKYHHWPEQAAFDRLRDETLCDLGWCTRRLWWEDVMVHPDRFVDVVRGDITRLASRAVRISRSHSG